MFQISLLAVLLAVSALARPDVDINLLQEENRLLAGSDQVQEKAIQYKSAGKFLPSSSEISRKNPSNIDCFVLTKKQN